MLKKALGLVITAVMLLGIFGLTACNNDTLDAYKTTGKAAIEIYAQERKANYCEDNWTVVCSIVTEGKTAVSDADSRAGVDTAVNEAKITIDVVQKEGEVAEWKLLGSSNCCAEFEKSEAYAEEFYKKHDGIR